MEYSIITKDEVQTVIGEAEKTLHMCFELLLDLRHARDNMANTLLTFQPLLAECLNELMTFYLKLQKEKNTLISRKVEFEHVTFAKAMRTNALYSDAIKSVIEMGKDLGDAFAWYFFRNNRKELDKHFQHKSTGLFTSGIGGLGELQFIKMCNRIDGCYVLYHGITSMLRIGDFSLYDFSNGTIMGVGEIKTKQIDDTLQISAAITTTEKISTPSSIEKSQSFTESINEIKKDFPKIEAQIKEQEDLFTNKESGKLFDQYTSYDHAILDGLNPAAPVALNSDNSLMILANWSNYESLNEILLNPEDFDIAENELKQRVNSFMKPESSYNMVFIGELNTRINMFGEPILWWHIDDKTCEDLYFKRMKITTMFNPAKVIQLFLDDGFCVIQAKKPKDFEIYKELNDARIRVGTFEIISSFIQNNLMKTKDAYESTKHLLDAINKGEIQQNTKIEMHIHLNSFGKE
ncbi:MAG: hypothetical protein K6G90_12505 [Clostridia bacterium]|nr:hypothetical protein [Clostridia bacterium]